MKQRTICFAFFAIFSINIHGQMKSLKTKDFKVNYEVSAEEYVKSSIKILELVKKIAIDLGFSLTKRIDFKVLKADKNMLFVDKKNPNLIIWQYVSINDFLSPKKSGYNNIYGLCHEMGHVCMFNITSNNNNWMTRDYREGWAHYFATLVIDSVYRTLGADIWPDKHNYEYFGMKNFIKKMETDTTTRNNGFFYSSYFWYKLSKTIGTRNLSKFFMTLDSEKVRNPNCDIKFESVLKEYNLDSDFVSDFKKNKEYLIREKKD